LRRSHTLTFHIERPYEAVYEFLVDPRNYALWAAVEKDTFRQLEDGDWEAETEFGGKWNFRFTPANPFGVLDHAAYQPGKPIMWMPMRAVANEEGTDLIVTFYQRPDASDEEFASAVEWITTDFLGLKSLLEVQWR
jgi:uncharacterized protein YndB with AHSA1/START domain